MPFIFYDTETTGADRVFDQILQFAAVLTDDELNVVDEFQIRSRLLPYVVPSPGAMVVTGVSVEQLFDPGTPSHYQMCRRIHAVMTAWSPATIVGYNSLRFDEELLRQAFYKSLLPIYLTNTNGNSRLDVLTMALAVHAFQPEALTWPINEKGRVSFKLDRLVPANGFDHRNAHDALADVHATIHIARLIRERAPAVWSAATAYRTKAAAAQYVETEPVFVATRLAFGFHSSRLVTALGLNPGNSSELLALDLQHDPAELVSMSDEQLAAHIATVPRPILSVKLNGCPVFMPTEIAGPLAPGHELGTSELAHRAQLVRNNPDLCSRLIAAVLAGRIPFEESPHVEERIYAGFYSQSDQAVLDDFHRSDWQRRIELSNHFEDGRLRMLARRIVYCEAPEVIPAETRVSYARAIADRLHTRRETTGRWTTLDDAIAEANELLEQDIAKRALVRDHLDWLKSRRKEAGALLTGPFMAIG
ncbi:exodeoxyribonuclease I [Mesorhizobium sp. ASY16-5R]|uniref:exodeoxyribonuclease I n=1 Tax=Mesorhizobium sp. ASY16-5R TaxID=3445772 RepID=UPI003F9F2838